MNRRNFLLRTGLSLGATSLLPSMACNETVAAPLSFWDEIRSQFLLSKDRIHMAQMLLASHPTPVREAIDKHRKALDENPTEYFENNFIQFTMNVQQAAAKYLQADPQEIIVTDSTTMGLGLLYTGLQLKPGDDVLSTVHDHYSTWKSLDFATSKNGADIRRVSLYEYETAAMTSEDELVGSLINAIKPNTRIVAVTWVHSVSGVKLPIGKMGAAIKELNQKRSEKDRIYFCVDGVHAFGIEDKTIGELNCDFFAAGTHKWIFGPRGTGILWAKKDAWDMLQPTIPPFTIAYYMWMETLEKRPLTFMEKMSPGGFKSYEHM